MYQEHRRTAWPATRYNQANKNNLAVFQKPERVLNIKKRKRKKLALKRLLFNFIYSVVTWRQIN